MPAHTLATLGPKCRCRISVYCAMLSLLLLLFLLLLRAYLIVFGAGSETTFHTDTHTHAHMCTNPAHTRSVGKKGFYFTSGTISVIVMTEIWWCPQPPLSAGVGGITSTVTYVCVCVALWRWRSQTMIPDFACPLPPGTAISHMVCAD